ncbi:hypothetical protein M3Y97_00855800 [Aphelenchoides bicaudatus]|nr:hypothetical protein M3Y97_00855800 [Aphelenchoides bicaudatus]
MSANYLSNATFVINSLLQLATANKTDDDDAEPKCTPFSKPGSKLGSQDACEFVKDNLDACEGGGYVLWTQLILCESDEIKRVIYIILAVIFLFYLFIMISASADDFFSTNIANLVDEHKISQSTAGVTFMAFGNGAPDIFSSIASVISTKKPKASLAVAELLGGGIFVTTIVIAGIVFVKPFKAAGIPFLRDSGFYLLALAWLTFIMLFDKQLFIWQPILFIVLYIIYVLTVLLTRLYYTKIKKKEEQKRKISRASSKIAELGLDFSRLENQNDFLKPPETSTSQPQMERTPPNIVFPLVKDTGRKFSYNSIDTLSQRTESTARNTLRINSNQNRKYSTLDQSWALPTSRQQTHKLSIMSIPKQPIFNGILVPKITLDLVDEPQPSHSAAHEGPYLDHGKFFIEPEMTDDEDQDETEVRSIASTTLTLQADRPVSIIDSRSRTQSAVETVPIEDTFFGELKQLLRYLNPFDVEEFKEGSVFDKVFMIIKIPCIFLFKLTIPVATHTWFKLLCMLHTITAPISFLFAFQIYNVQIFTDKLELWMLVLSISILLSILLGVFTRSNKSPPHFRKIISYVGFIASTGWIYAIAAEVVGIVLLLGVLSKISFDILGLTLIAWSNSLGDLIADYTVAKNGFSKMALGAAVGGPLFNLMIGFGISFLIAKIQGKRVIVKMDGILKIMLIALATSLIASIIILASQRFQARRFHSFILIGIYVVFLIFVVLQEVKHIF